MKDSINSNRSQDIRIGADNLRCKGSSDTRSQGFFIREINGDLQGFEDFEGFIQSNLETF